MSMKLYLLHFFREQQTSNYFQTFRVFYLGLINYNFHIDNDYFFPAVGEGESVLIMIRRQPVLSNPDLI